MQNNSNKRIVGVIPARYASSRFPGKPLADIGGKSMIERVYQQAAQVSAFSDLIVATDDQRVSQAVKAFGGKVMMTSEVHNSGTERCAEVAASLLHPAAIIVNIQGDEPFIQPEQIQLLLSSFERSSEVQIASLAKAIESPEELNDTNVVKVVMGAEKQALYFSRYPIPFQRESNTHVYYKHIGMYAYKTEILKAISMLPPHNLEQAESLEQLRWLAYDYRIQMAITTHQALSVDTPEDLQTILQGLCV